MVQHSFHEVSHLLVGQDQCGQLGLAVSRDEDARGVVDPHFFNLWIVQIPLEGAKADNLGQQVFCVLVDFVGGERPEHLRDGFLGQLPGALGVRERVDAAGCECAAQLCGCIGRARHRAVPFALQWAVLVITVTERSKVAS